MLFSLAALLAPMQLLPNGFEDCPCIDPWPLAGYAADNSTCSGFVREGKCYEKSYGSNGCRAYDHSRPSCQAKNAPAWCTCTKGPIP